MSLDLIVFGGTFDPPHLGHLRAVEAAHNLFPKARILVAPNPKTPSAFGQFKTRSTATFEDRLTMCHLLFISDNVGTDIEVSDVESQLPSPHYTTQLLKFLSLKYPDARIGFLMGQDQVETFDKWSDPVGILANADLIVVSRHTDLNQSIDTTETLHSLLNRLNLKFSTDSRGIQIPELECRIFIVKQPVSNAQSSLLRNDIGKNKSFEDSWLTPPLVDFIKQRQLYQQG